MKITYVNLHLYSHFFVSLQHFRSPPPTLIRSWSSLDSKLDSILTNWLAQVFPSPTPAFLCALLNHSLFKSPLNMNYGFSGIFQLYFFCFCPFRPRLPPRWNMAHRGFRSEIVHPIIHPIRKFQNYQDYPYSGDWYACLDYCTLSSLSHFSLSSNGNLLGRTSVVQQLARSNMKLRRYLLPNSSPILYVKALLTQESAPSGWK